MSPDYKPVSIEAARWLSHEFAKAVVVIFTIDRVHDCAHYTTYGQEPRDKLETAHFGDVIATVISAEQLQKKTVFADFREEAAQLKADLEAVTVQRDLLRAACRDAVETLCMDTIQEQAGVPECIDRVEAALANVE